MAFYQQKILVLDRGSKFYKGMLIEYGLGNFQILKIEKLPMIKELIYENSTSDQKINDEEFTISEYNFLRFAKTLFTEQEEIIFLLKNEEVFIRNLEIPAEKEELAKQIYQNEIENYIPVSLEEVQIISHVWEISESRAKVLGFAAQNHLLESFSSLLIENGFSLKMLGLESVALANAIELLPEDEYIRKNVCQLDIGYSKTLVNYLYKGKLIFTRNVSFGVETLINIVQVHTKKLKWNIEEIQTFVFKKLFSFYLNFHKDTDFDISLNKEELSKFYQDLDIELRFFTEELKRTFSTFDYENFSFLLLSGGGSLIHGISDFIEQKLNIQVKYYEIQLANENIEPWIVCLGAFLHYRKNPKQKLDFLNTYLGKSIKKGEIRLKALLIPVSMIIFSILIFFISFIFRIILEKKEFEFYQAKIQEIALQIPEIGKSQNPVQKAKQICEEKLNYWKNIIAGVKFLDILKEIEENTPSPEVAKIQFKSLRYFENQINLEIVVDSISQVVKVQEDLQKSRMFSSVEVVRRDILTGQKVRLEININIKPKDIQLNIDCK